MTDWIDELAARLEPADAERNKDRTDQRDRERLISEQGPALFEQLARQIEALAVRLDRQLGATFNGVLARSRENVVIVNSGKDHDGRFKVVVDVKFERDRARIRAGWQVTGPQVYENARHVDYRIDADNPTGVWHVFISRADGSAARFDQPADAAADMLREPFEQAFKVIAQSARKPQI